MKHTMREQEEQIHRSWIEMLLSTGFRDLSAAVVDAELNFLRNDYDCTGMTVDLPPDSFMFLKPRDKERELLERALKLVLKGRVYDRDGGLVPDPVVEFRVRLLPVTDNWRDKVRELIAVTKTPNQGVVSELMANKNGRTLYEYNGMRFASRSEIRIAQALETKGVLFFPLPLAVMAQTGNAWQDHREPDFLVCHNGAFGILEVSYHLDRYEKDCEKDVWFKKAGILCIQHYTAERCYREPEPVVDEFLTILAKHCG